MQSEKSQRNGHCLGAGGKCWPWRAACPVQSGEPKNATGMFAKGGSVQREVHVRSTPVCQCCPYPPQTGVS